MGVRGIGKRCVLLDYSGRRSQWKSSNPRLRKKFYFKIFGNVQVLEIVVRVGKEQRNNYNEKLRGLHK